jgi:hypothetical protein
VLVYTCVGVHVCWCARVLVCTCVGVHVCWCARVLVCTCVGVHVCWCARVLVCTCVGVHVCWSQCATRHALPADELRRQARTVGRAYCGQLTLTPTMSAYAQLYAVTRYEHHVAACTLPLMASQIIVCRLPSAGGSGKPAASPATTAVEISASKTRPAVPVKYDMYFDSRGSTSTTGSSKEGVYGRVLDHAAAFTAFVPPQQDVTVQSVQAANAQNAPGSNGANALAAAQGASSSQQGSEHATTSSGSGSGSAGASKEDDKARQIHAMDDPGVARSK